MKDKILLALQFWAGDKKPAMETARLIADLEPRKSEKADFLFVSRYDCTQEQETVEYVSRKFNVYTHINRSRQGNGWPHGCNELWFGTMDHVYDYGRAKKIPTYKAVLTFESDACPIVPHWITRLSDLWDEAGVKVLGPMQRSPGLHINGNALFSGDPAFLKLIGRDIGGCSPQGGWDYILSPVFKKQGWADCAPMKSFWGCKTMNEEFFSSLLVQNVCFVHGVKDSSLRQMVRSKFLLGR